MAGTTTNSSTEAAPQAAPQIDLRALADKVYELMKKELRLERQRLGNNRNK